MNSNIIRHLKTEINQLLPEIKKIRQDFHQIPELALEEYQTSERIRELLQPTSIRIRNPLIKTDVVGELMGKNSEKIIALRADIDGLPIEEKTGVDYISRNRGLMHACGHDGHISILLGTALVLERMKNNITNSIRFIFQPGEEMQAAGAMLVERGVLDGVNEVYALHGLPGAPVGSINSSPGVLLAAAHQFYFKIKGRGGHGATPHLANNPIPVASEITLKLNKLGSDFQKYPAIVSVTSIRGGNSATIIPDEAVIAGTARYLDKRVGETIERRIKEVVSKTCKKNGIGWEIDYDKKYYLPVVNFEGKFNFIKNLAEKCIGPQSFKTLPSPLMWAEDFAFYLDIKPGCMFLLGLGEDSSNLHSSTFDFNDQAIFHGILMFSLLALTS
jgi:amidohydrolase